MQLFLRFGVLFYDYIPNNKTVPSVPTYKTSDSVKQEIEEVVTEGETVLVTYQVTADDLKQLEAQGNYPKGKVDPFSTYVKPVEPTEDENNVTGNNSINTNVTTNKGGTTSNGTFYNNTGTK